MKIEQTRWTPSSGWSPAPPGRLDRLAQLVFCFGATPIFQIPRPWEDLRRAYPGSRLVGCSTAGEIGDVQVTDDSLVVTAVAFDSTRVEGAQTRLAGAGDSEQAGERLARSLDPEGLVHALVFSEGLNVNGSELVRGLTRLLPEGVTVTGGLAGDGTRHHETLVTWDGEAAHDTIAILGFYGERLRVGFGSLGGWDPFGPERRITRSQGNVLYELDGRPALDLYELYLGKHAEKLPASGLLFPLTLRTEDGDPPVVRSLVSIGEKDRSVTFAGDVPVGAYARLMKANFERLIDGAIGAATTSYAALEGSRPDFALLISCVGRKSVLQQRVEDEIEGVREVLGESAVLTGFYSYGEIAPFAPRASCELHNQTMTVTTFSER